MDNAKSIRSIVKEWTLDVRPHLYSKFSHEMVSVMIFHFIGSIAPTAMANSVVLMVLVFYTAKTSGAHLNPAASLTFMLLGHTNPIELLVYWMAQVTGAICGALWIACLLPLQIGHHTDHTDHTNGIIKYRGCFIPHPDLTKTQVFGWEAVCTFTFLVPVFSVVWYTTQKKGYGNTGPIMIGLSLLGSALAAGPFTGASLNPARTLGSAIVFDCKNTSFLGSYIAGEMCAACIVPFFIMPWFGIHYDAWYMRWIPDSVKINYKTTCASVSKRFIDIEDRPSPSLRERSTVMGDSVNILVDQESR